MSRLYLMVAWVFWFLVNRLFLSQRARSQAIITIPGFHWLHWPESVPGDLCCAGYCWCLRPGSDQVPPPGLRCPKLHRRRVSDCLWVILETQVGHLSADHLHDNRTLVGSELIGIQQRIAASRCHNSTPDTSDCLNRLNWIKFAACH